jgi:hypothetical protein
VIPDHDLSFGDQHIGVAVPIKVHKPQIRVVPPNLRKGLERPELIPAPVWRTFKKTWRWRIQFDKVQLPIARHIHQLLASAFQSRKRRPLPNKLDRSKPATAKTGLVEPLLALFGQDS